MKIYNLEGHRFGRLVVVSKGEKRGERRLWKCICDCGVTREAVTSTLINGTVKSCGCFRVDRAGRLNLAHGHARNRRSPTYGSWRAMIRRCYEPQNISYEYYGARGSGQIWMMGILANSTSPRDPDAEIPFVAFVMAQATKDREKKALASHAHWNRKLWKSPVTAPNGLTAKTTPIEIRATDLDHPSVVEGTYGQMPDGRSIVHCELNGVAVSFTFNDKEVQIMRGHSDDQ